MERLARIIESVRSADPLRSEPLRLVLAPKTQSWDIKNGSWSPTEGRASVARRLRPLSHVSARDQIQATAFMLLLADGIETRQGDPRGCASDARQRNIVSYGHRLLCDTDTEGLHFRWGNSVVYRRYFQDYQQFVSRPEEIVREAFGESTDWAMAQPICRNFTIESDRHCYIKRSTIYLLIPQSLLCSHNCAPSSPGRGMRPTLRRRLTTRLLPTRRYPISTQSRCLKGSLQADFS